jgi:hypothetical protein
MRTLGWLAGLLAFSVIASIVLTPIDRALGIQALLKDLSFWKQVLHQVVWGFWGMLIYVVFVQRPCKTCEQRKM